MENTGAQGHDAAVSADCPLLEAIELKPNGEGRYLGQATHDWSFFAPSGGVLMSTALLGARRTLNQPEQTLCSATAVFAEAVREGPIDVTAEVWRQGGGASQLQSALYQATEHPALRVLSTFARARDGVVLSDATYPDVPHWSDCPEWPHPPNKPIPFFGNFEERKALGHAWSETDWPAGPPRYARWMRYLQPPRSDDGTLDVLAYPPVIDMMPPSVLQGLLPGERAFLAPSLDLTVHIYGTTKRDWLLMFGRCRQTKNGLASAEIEVWDEDKQLLAYGTQQMMLRRFKRLSGQRD